MPERALHEILGLIAVALKSYGHAKQAFEMRQRFRSKPDHKALSSLGVVLHVGVRNPSASYPDAPDLFPLLQPE